MAPTERTSTRIRRWRSDRKADQEVREANPGLITQISADDEMLDQAGGHRHYFTVGESALRAIEQAVGERSVGSVIDLPCGHGRVLRWLAHRWPDARLVACDLNRDGVDFCARTFDAEPVYSSINLLEVDLGKADLVWSGSLLTHLSEERWSSTLEAFRSAVTPGGVIVFTTHGDRALERIRTQKTPYGSVDHEALAAAYQTAGFGYDDYDGAVAYGISLTRPDRVRALIAAAGLEVSHFSPASWHNHQDVWGCVPR